MLMMQNDGKIYIERVVTELTQTKIELVHVKSNLKVYPLSK